MSDNDDAGRDAQDDQTDESGQDDKGEDVSGLKAALVAERKSVGDLKRQVRDLTKKLDEADGKGKSEMDKLSDRLESIIGRLKERGGRDAVRDAATKAGSPKPDLVYRLVRADLAFDDDGEPTNVDDLIRELKGEDPDLFKKPAGSADAGKGRGGREGVTGDWVRDGLAARR